MNTGQMAGLTALSDVELETIARAVRQGLTPSPLTASALAELSVGDRAGWLVGLDTEAVLAAIIAVLAERRRAMRLQACPEDQSGFKSRATQKRTRDVDSMRVRATHESHTQHGWASVPLFPAADPAHSPTRDENQDFGHAGGSNWHGSSAACVALAIAYAKFRNASIRGCVARP
jgi:hypothetical protein